MRDFTLDIYRELLVSLQKAGYRFLTFQEYCEGEGVRNKEEGVRNKEDERRIEDGRFVILRHDVDLRAPYSLRTAEIESQLNIRASYYFRVVKQSNQPTIIQSIAALGHEIGYHYEDMSICGGDVDKAIVHFRKYLAYFRSFYPVCTICMHGAPTSQFDGKDLWKKYNYRDEGIIGEPYFDVDFSKLVYLTDTGRCWDGYKVSVRDKIPEHQDRWCREGLSFRHTEDIIAALSDSDSALSQKAPCLMITTHPQRWSNNYVIWLKELVLQNMKNIIKRLIICLKE